MAFDWDSFSDKFSLFGEGFGRWLKGTFGSQNARVVRNLVPVVEQVNALESWAKGLSAEQFKQETSAFRERFKGVDDERRKALLEELLPKAFALVREASVRTLGLRHFDVQIVGGIVLHQGAIAEMMTGEGKTLVATLPLYLNCLTGKPVYLVTVNDYLARRDCAWMKPIFDYLGVSTGAIQSSMGSWERKPVYACDIVYGTNNEFGFDYLRDNMKNRAEEQVQKILSFAIIDEVDSVLIDEARTPLIISGPAEESSGKYKIADMVARKLERDTHFEVKEKERTATLKEAGIVEAEKLVGVQSFYTPGNEDWPHYIENALRAHNLYRLDDQYVVEPGEDGHPEVVIVDEFTGRKMQGRRWSDGLHQAVEVKEGLNPRQENQTLATITFQNYFRLFRKLAGMTGTALTEANEFWKIYQLRVVSIPTNLKIARNDAEDIVYRTAKEKWKAIADEIEARHRGRAAGAKDFDGNELPALEPGQPILVGTTSVEKSELLSSLLKQRGVRHEVLNAKNHEREANIVAHAGEMSAVTVATNMAGRGTDIKLGGNYEWRLNQALKDASLVQGDPAHLDEIAKVRERVRADCDRDQAAVLQLGGLYVLGTERHEARRIDNQLRGRSGRQGDVGYSRFYLSLEDDLMRRFYRDWVKNAMERMGMSEGVPIESRMVTRAIERAQRKVEDYNFEIRKSLLEYDDVMDQQRKTIYSVRQDVLEGRGLRERTLEFLEKSIVRNAANYVQDPDGFATWFHRSFGIDCSRPAAHAATEKTPEFDKALGEALAHYEKREASIGPEMMRRVEQYILLNALDSRWKDHLHAIDALKTGIGLRGYGQQDPKNEYKREGFQLFESLLAAVEDEVGSLALRIRIQAPNEGEDGSSTSAGPKPAPKPAHSAPPAPERGNPATAPPSTGAPRGSSTSAFDRIRTAGLKKPAGEAPRPTDATLSAASGAAAPASQPAPPASPPAAPAAAPSTPAGAAPSAPAPSVPATHAFDLKRRLDAIARAKEAQAAAANPAGTGDFQNVDRNAPCPCGSGKKFKKCHGVSPSDSDA
ncbi:MAG: preprotein translocase subunit SecA [Planctomycetes bacterium]|nr:preprotein translocase subunit SecA [Planctomycetota bacterium]